MVSTWHDQISTQVQESEQVNCLYLLKHYLNQSHLSTTQNAITIIPSLQNEKDFFYIPNSTAIITDPKTNNLVQMNMQGSFGTADILKPVAFNRHLE